MYTYYAFPVAQKEQ